VKQEIGRKSSEANRLLKALGPERSTPAAQASYLIDLATQYQQLAMLSLQARFGSDERFDRFTALRLAPIVMARAAIFESDMASHGHIFKFTGDQTQKSVATVLIDVNETNTPVPTSDKSRRSQEEGLSIRREEDDADIADMLHPHKRLINKDRSNIEAWLRVVYNTSRGFELGTFDASILAITMKKQSFKWSSISLGYTSDVIVLVHRFITTALRAIISDDSLTDSLFNIMLDGLQRQYKRAIEQVEFLLDIELNGTPMTMNHYFNDNLEKW
jgi:hypothetical protein